MHCESQIWFVRVGPVNCMIQRVKGLKGAATACEEGQMGRYKAIFR
jgi:hypothetical protein